MVPCEDIVDDTTLVWPLQTGEYTLHAPAMLPTYTNPLGCLVPLLDLSKNPVEGFSAGLVDDGNIFEVCVKAIPGVETVTVSTILTVCSSFVVVGDPYHGATRHTLVRMAEMDKEETRMQDLAISTGACINRDI